MVEIPEIYVDYNPMAFLQHKKVHLREARLNLAQVTVIKNESGETNINALKTAQKAPAEKPAQPGERKKAAPMPDIQIDSLAIKIG